MISVPYLSYREHDNWQAGGSRDYAARAREVAGELLERHRPEPLDEEVDGRLRELAGVGR